jgi:hypothetical protein
MLKPLRRVAGEVVEGLRGFLPEHREALRVLLHQRERPAPTRPSATTLAAAMGWLKRAQDACPAGGVSWGYRARKDRNSSSALGWQPAYPETTGYIIETFLEHARSAPESDSRERARRMADWESRVQLPDGGIQGGVYGAQPVASSTFVTGQVLFGWVRAFEEFGEPLHRDSALRAGDFLLSCLDDTGRFAKGYSLFCVSGPKAYEARTGWALARLGQLTGEGRFSEAADRMARYALSCRRANGWFDQNDLNYHDQPLTHTIAYVLEGLWGTGNLLGRTQYQDAVRETLGRLGTLVREDGFLAGRWRSSWEPAVSWSCLTGSAQIAGVALRVHGMDSSSETLELAGRLLGFVAATQLRDDWPSGFRGGIHGSYPFGGDYGRWCVLNWATKFYADSVMLWLERERVEGVITAPPPVGRDGSTA